MNPLLIHKEISLSKLSPSVHLVFQTGLLARLRMYPDGRPAPLCGQLDFMNTSAWKERILSDYQNTQGDSRPSAPPASSCFLLVEKMQTFILLSYTFDKDCLRRKQEREGTQVYVKKMLNV